MKIALAQIAPVLLDRDATLMRVVDAIGRAADAGCSLVAFGEALVPGYPVWLDRAGGARFDDPVNKAIHARYVDQAVQPEAGDLDAVAAAARERGLAVVLGIIERAADRGGVSLYCSRVFFDRTGTLLSVHRKLVPTYEERLAWSPGDGAGLVVHRVGGFTVGALNCWENWMPMARAALHAQGEDLHIAIWPGGDHNTRRFTQFAAREARSFVASVSGLIRESDVPADFPHRDRLDLEPGSILCNGGTSVASPDGSWLVEPVVDREELVVVELDRTRVLEERQNFDPSGHYARPDVFQLHVDRRRQRTVEFRDDQSQNT